MADTLERVKTMVAERMEVDVAKITENTDIMKDLGADSLDLVEIVMAFEEEFSIEIPEEVHEKIATIGDIVTHIDSLAS